MLRILAVLLLLLPTFGFGQIIISNSQVKYKSGSSLSIFVDTLGTWKIEDIAKSAPFTLQLSGEPNYQYTHLAVWGKLTLINQQELSNLAVEISNPQLDSIWFYIPKGDGFTEIITGDNFDYGNRPVDHQQFVFPVELPTDSALTVYFKVRSEEQLILPVHVGTVPAVQSSHSGSDAFIGLYLGIMLVMFFYNLFIWLSVRDKSYFFYIVYILGIAMAQAGLQGFSFKFLFSHWPEINKFSVVFFSTLTGIGAISFTRSFLHLKERLPVIHRSLYVFVGLYLLSVVVFLAGYSSFTYYLLDLCAFLLSFYALGFSIYLSLKKIRSARFFLLAWSFFIVGLFVYVGRNLGWLPNNFFTTHVLMMGSAVEAILLSIALADRINILKREKEESQAEALRISQENEKLVREQNVILEQKVKERTLALEQTNNELSTTLSELKNTQTQLVNSEKMASLGQLTAGIAHEINNPINFVTSNIRPLRRDMNDLTEMIQKFEEIIPENATEIKDKLKAIKKEMDFDYLKEEINVLISGMEEGAFRTAEIVKGLRTFSRLDESDLKKVNINEGIDSTLILLNSSMGGRIELIRNYDEDALLECYPGKLNQVFMNILNNAIQAIHGKDGHGSGKLTITTKSEGNVVKIGIRDTGPGMDEATKEKIFDPFFTTKPVGQGTGLGLSIVYSIIESHKGSIAIDTAPGRGTEFILTLPKLHK
jgi:hypothetical protein